MPEHNGDYSPEAEYKRKLKREKVQRGRIRRKIEEGRASAEEIAAIDAWERGEPWTLGAGELLPVATARPAQDRPPRASRTRAVAQASAQDAEEETPLWVTLAKGAGVALFIGVCIVIGVKQPHI